MAKRPTSKQGGGYAVAEFVGLLKRLEIWHCESDKPEEAQALRQIISLFEGHHDQDFAAICDRVDALSAGMR